MTSTIVLISAVVTFLLAGVAWLLAGAVRLLAELANKNPSSALDAAERLELAALRLESQARAKSQPETTPGHMIPEESWRRQMAGSKIGVEISMENRMAEVCAILVSRERGHTMEEIAAHFQTTPENLEERIDQALSGATYDGRLTRMPLPELIKHAEGSDIQPLP